MLHIFIGYDSKEVVAYNVLQHSIIRQAKYPVCITPVVRDQIEDFSRARGRNESTEFTYTRFMVPYLCNFKGFSVFMDCDMLAQCDINEIMRIIDPKYAVSVVKHDYTPKTWLKFLGQEQTRYEKKNWSSFMVFNNELCTALTPQYVNRATGMELHQFKWLESEDLIGELPVEWNHLVGEYERNPKAKIVHYTLGTPCFPEYSSCEYAQQWFTEKAYMLDYYRDNAWKGDS